jgi:hypothetical protein
VADAQAAPELLAEEHPSRQVFGDSAIRHVPGRSPGSTFCPYNSHSNPIASRCSSVSSTPSAASTDALGGSEELGGGFFADEPGGEVEAAVDVG